MKGYLFAVVIALGLLHGGGNAAAVTFSPDPSATWSGFMNVFDLPSNGGGYVFGSGWGTADLRANFTGPVLALEAAPIATGDAFWYQNGSGGAGAAGNKNMDANMYVERNDLGGQTVTFEGTVLSNTLVAPYTSVAFIKDFAPDFSSFVQTTAPLTPGNFNISLIANAAPGRHIQYGFETIGPNVWPTDVASKGAIQITAIPEPASCALLSAGTGAMLLRRRRPTV